MLYTEQRNFIRVRASQIRALWIGEQNTGYLLYVDGINQPFPLTEDSAKEAGYAMDQLYDGVQLRHIIEELSEINHWVRVADYKDEFAREQITDYIGNRIRVISTQGMGAAR
jgi:hypothetical protein